MPKDTSPIHPITTKYRYSIKTKAGAEVANSGDELYDTIIQALSASREYKESNNLLNCTGYVVPVETPVLDLYTQVKHYILSTWSQSCITWDHNNYIQANNGHLHIWCSTKPGETPFLVLMREDESGRGVIFNGYIRNIEDFKLLLDLTSVQKSDWAQ